MDTLPLYYDQSSLESSTSDSSRLSFPVSVRSLAYSERDSTPVPPIPPRPEQYRNVESASRTSRASKRGSVMFLNGPQGLVSGRDGTQQDWMKQFKPLGEEEEEDDDARATPSSLFPDSTIDPTQLPARSSSRSPVHSSDPPPTLPPRPTKLSSPIPPSPPNPASTVLSSPSSSCPPALSPFASMSASSVTTTTKPTMGPPPLPARSKSPRFRPSTSSFSSPSNSSASPVPNQLSTSSSSSSLNFGTSAFSAAFNRGLKQTGLKDRFAAGVGFTKEWGGKGKGKLEELAQRSSQQPPPPPGSQSRPSNANSWETRSGASIPSSASSPQFETFPSSSSPSTTTSPSLPFQSTTSTTTPNSIKLPCMIFDVMVPRITGVAFGTRLSTLVASTSISCDLPPRPVSLCPITGDTCTLYLPAIAYRCLEYLSSDLGSKEEGIYRIPGRSHMVQQLKSLFDSGKGKELDLRELHQSRLDPNAVASCFKSWLRELPESLMSNELEPRVDQLSLDHLGYTASSAHFLSSTTTTTTTTTPQSPNNPPSNTTSPNPAAAAAAAASRPVKYLEELAELFAEKMPAENFYLLRAIAYHLALLASHSATNKMTLTNLRLILSPTLRLSPGFLLVLVEEREIIFGGVNQDAKRRRARTSHLVTPPLLSVPTFSSTTSSPTLVIAPPPRSTTPISSSTPPHPPPPLRQTTPIADKFSLSAIPLAPTPPPPPPPPPTGAAAAAAPSLSTTTTSYQNYVPPRRVDTSQGFFSSRLIPLNSPSSSTTTTTTTTTTKTTPVLQTLAKGGGGGEEERRNDQASRTNTQEEEKEEEGETRSRKERIKSQDLKLSLPEGFGQDHDVDSFGGGGGGGGLGLGLGFGGISLRD